MSLAFLFPGQGSQVKGMGTDVFHRYPELIEQANQELGYSLSDLCLEDAKEQLSQTQFTQPALFLVSFLEGKAKIDDGQIPDVAAGHSVGEFAALALAGCVSFLDGLRMVSKRGNIMSQVTGGGMAAVIGMEVEKIQSTLEQIGAEQVDLANFNSPGQVVISGPAAQIKTTLIPLKDAGARMVVPLKVSGAFHSRMMEEPAREFGKFLEEIRFSSPQFPVYSNVEAAPYSNGDAIAPLLVRQIHSSVRWTELITQMRKDGASEFLECGPGKVLTKLLKQIP
ncbi:ACP S-malonyltransferase [Opitutales bacterium]|uniref:ACP S-malonyltransferase n=1 Tax=Candidatus Chordibacter forsetii TaxID=3381758 RepID=UPI00230F67D0|nr:ACP S-malonyltransferase [bacterium]MDB3957351.1 ACP S-malonyltransferase [Opitutales bacterium]MDC3284206.1 ACP S-malonyltransferase [Opitutales bacterium]